MRRIPLVPVLGVFLCLTLAVSKLNATDAAASYESTFGQAERAALATASMKDDLDLAAKLLVGAGTIQNDLPYAALLREKAFDLSIKDPAGLSTAVSATEALTKADPKGHAGYRLKLLDGSRALYAKATRADKARVGAIYLNRLINEANITLSSAKRDDAEALYRQSLTLATTLKSPRTTEIKSRLKDFEGRRTSQQKINRLADRLKKEPQNKTLARDLAITCMTELDDPTQATPFALVTGDNQLQDIIELAIKAKRSDAEGITPAESLRLADWYKSAADQAPATAKEDLLTRAATLYQVAADDQSTSEADKLRVDIAMNDIQSKIRKLRPDSPGLDLVGLINPKRDLVGFAVENGSLAKKDGWGTIQFPYVPPDEYDYEIVFTRNTGALPVQQVCYHPSTKTSFRWLWGEAGTSGLERTDGKPTLTDADAIKNSAIINGRKYHALIKVRDTNIQVFLDGRHLVDFPTDYKNVKNSKVTPEADRLGIGTVPSITVESAEVKEMSGRGKVIK